MRRLALCLALALAAPLRADPVSPADAEFFEKQVRPLLAERCDKCHGGPKVKGGLRLTSHAELLAGGDSGPAVVPGKPAESLLVKAVRYEADGLRMPPEGRLSAADVATLVRWVERGAPWPDTATTAKPTPRRQVPHHQRTAPLLVVPPRDCPCPSGREGHGLARQRYRPLPSGDPGGEGAQTGPARRQGHVDPQGHLRPHGSTADTGRGCRLREGRLPGGVRERGGPAASGALATPTRRRCSPTSSTIRWTWFAGRSSG
jgi:hypothetical protein